MIVAEMIRVVVLKEIVKLLGCLKNCVLVEGNLKGQLVLTVGVWRQSIALRLCRVEETHYQCL